MAEYQIEYQPERVFKAIDRIPMPDRKRIVDRIEALGNDPRPHGAEKMSGPDGMWRVRQGNYRVVYLINDQERIITIARVAKRGEVYR